MASNKELKSRIENIRTTSQIIAALDMVASTRLNAAQKSLAGVRPIQENLDRLVKEISKKDQAKNHPFFKEREIKNSLYVVVTSDSGFAGSYNANIKRKASNHIKENHKSPKLYIVGTKGVNHFRKKNYEIVKTVVDISTSEIYYGSLNIANYAAKAFLEEEVDEVFLAYTYFENILSHDPRIERILPITPSFEEELDEEREIIIEPDLDTYIEGLVPLYMHMSLFWALSESNTAEQASRMVSMDNAGKNANEILEELQLTYNKQRQNAITTELSEIIGSRTVMNKGD